MFITVISSWWSDTFISVKCPSFISTNNFCFKSILSDIGIAVPAFFMGTVCMVHLFHSFTLNLILSLSLSCVSCGHGWIMGCFFFLNAFFQSAMICPLYSGCQVAGFHHDCGLLVFRAALWLEWGHGKMLQSLLFLLNLSIFKKNKSFLDCCRSLVNLQSSEKVD